MSQESIKVLSDTIQKLERRNAQRSLHKILEHTRAPDLAQLLRMLPDHLRVRVFLHLEGHARRAEVLKELDDDILAAFLEGLPDEELAPLLEELPSDDRVYVLAALPEERKERLLGTMKSEELDEAEELMRHAPESAGGIMSTEFFALHREITCAQAIQTLQAKHEELEMAFYLYVINENQHLVGVASLRQLVVSPADRTLSEIMVSDVVRVKTTDPQGMVAQLVARYNLLALPVVDEANRLVGIVTVDDVIDVIRSEATEDMLKLVGAGEELETSSIWQATRSRLPWLFASWMGGLGASLIIQNFQAEISKIALLAAFIPVILGMGGNVGTQSLTVVTRGLALGHIHVGELMRVVVREGGIGALCGLSYGVLLGVVSGVLARNDPSLLGHGGPLRLGLTVGLALGAAMLLASLVGSTVPLLFQRLSIDPAVATGPFVTTSVDVLGTVFYFLTASALLTL
jgi:magnesium transporter